MYIARSVRSRKKNLRVQADVPHTFWTLLLPLAAILIGLGAFLVYRPIADPLGAGIESALVGAVALACGLLLMMPLLRSVKITVLSRRERDEKPVQAKPRQVVHRKAGISHSANLPRPARGAYTDNTRISL